MQSIVLIFAAYIADDKYDEIWEELNRRQVVVFLHGAQTASSTPYPHSFLGIPITEVSLDRTGSLTSMSHLTA